jgi:hypothetical protein
MGLNRFDRIRIHRRNVTEMADAKDEGRLEQFAAELTGERRREILWSLVESVQLVDAMDALDKQGCVVPKSLLERALQGPADAYLESHQSNQGRNAMFEIAIAAGAALAGSKPLLGGEPDILFEFESRRILVQCKRVLSDNAVPKRMNEAAKQLTRDLTRSCEQRDCGLIAISISRIVNHGDRMLTVPNEMALAEALRDEIDSIFKRHQKAIHDVKTPKIAGVLFQVATPSYVQDLQLFTAAQSTSIFHIPGKSDATLLEKLAGGMKF